MDNANKEDDYIVLIGKKVDFEDASRFINAALNKGITITGAVAQKDDGVLISNRIDKKMPIIDEVSLIEKVPLGMKAAIEVASPGGVVEVLANPYGIATVFDLSSEETKMIVPIARALIGNRSAVVIKTPKGDVQARSIPAGKITVYGKRNLTIDVDEGAEK